MRRVFFSLYPLNFSLLNLWFPLLLLLPGFARATTIYVDDDNTSGPWDGTPEYPYQYIQDGIDAAAHGDTVLVSDGIYTGPRNKNLCITGKAITVALQNGPDQTIVDCENDGRGFVFVGENTQGSVLRGFTITRGAADVGGGIRCGSSVTIMANVLIDNFAPKGGGIFCTGR